MDLLAQLKPGTKASEYHALAVYILLAVMVARGDLAMPWEAVFNVGYAVMLYMALRTVVKLLDIWAKTKALPPEPAKP